MPATLNIAQDSRVADEIPPQYLAVQAAPAIVDFAERTHLRFLESLKSRLTIALGTETGVAFIGTEQSFLARYLTDREPGFHNVALSLEPIAGIALLRFSADLLFKILDMLLASPAETIGTRSESVTDIELHLLRGFFQTFSDALRETWQSVPAAAFVPALTRGEENLRFGESHVLAMQSTLEIDGARGSFAVVIPAFVARLSASLPISNGDKTRGADTGFGSMPARIAEALSSVKVDMDAVLSDLTIRIGDLVDLTPGQVVLGGKAADSSFDCFVNKRRQFSGELVPAGDRYGFQLTHARAKETESPAER